jgi:hypothetical protein
MSDFFGGLSGNIRFTDARINGDGPLPTSLSGPEGINGDADGRYNFNDSLLSGIAPYAGPKGGRMGSDRNYQQIPHRKQFVVPPVFLPEPDPNLDQTFMMSHGIDMGDIAFILNVRHKRFMLTPAPYAFVTQEEDDSMPNYNIFCNICTVNYLLAGLHNYLVTQVDRGLRKIDQSHAWGRLLICFDAEKRANHILKEAEPDKFVVTTFRCQLLLQEIVRQKIIPLGICAMSEKQGGQHEVGLKPVQAAASFFTTLTVDGQNRDLVNIWRSIDINAGDFLILRLDFMHEDKNIHTKRPYTLNHYYKETIMKTLVMHAKTRGTLQLVPDVFSSSYQRTQDWYFEALKLHLDNDDILRSALDYRQLGYWHIGQTYTKKLSFSGPRAPTNDNEMMQGQLLQINFAPVWKGKTEGLDKFEHVTKKNFKFVIPYILQKFCFGKIDGGVFGGGGSGGGWSGEDWSDEGLYGESNVLSDQNRPSNREHLISPQDRVGGGGRDQTKPVNGQKVGDKVRKVPDKGGIDPRPGAPPGVDKDPVKQGKDPVKQGNDPVEPGKGQELGNKGGKGLRQEAPPGVGKGGGGPPKGGGDASSEINIFEGTLSDKERHDEAFEGVIERKGFKKAKTVTTDAKGSEQKSQFDIDLENIYQGFDELKSKQPVQDKPAKAGGGANAV